MKENKYFIKCLFKNIFFYELKKKIILNILNEMK